MMTEEKPQDNTMQLASHVGDEKERVKEGLEETPKQLENEKDKFEAMAATGEQLQNERKSAKELEDGLAERQQNVFEAHAADMERIMAKTEQELIDLEDLKGREEKRATHGMKNLSVVRDRIIYEWKIDNAKSQLSQSTSTSIQSPQFPPGATGRRWQLSLVIERGELDVLLPHLTVIDSPSPVVKAAVNLLVLRGRGWTSIGSDDTQITIDAQENKTGTALIDDSYMTLEELQRYVSKHDDSVTIRCEITVCDSQRPDATTRHPQAPLNNAGLADAGIQCSTESNLNKCRPKVVCSLQ